MLCLCIARLVMVGWQREQRALPGAFLLPVAALAAHMQAVEPCCFTER